MSKIKCPKYRLALKKKILSEKELTVAPTERTDPSSLVDRSNVVPATLGRDRLPSDGTTDTDELLDTNQRTNYNRGLRRNRVSPLPMRRNLDESNMSAVPEKTFYPIRELIMIKERENLVSGK